MNIISYDNNDIDAPIETFDFGDNQCINECIKKFAEESWKSSIKKFFQTSDETFKQKIAPVDQRI